MKSLLYKSSLFLLVFSAVSCFSTDDRNYQYFPNMYVSEAYEAYGNYEVFQHGQSAKLPVKGTIPRGWMPFEYENTNEDYLAAKANLKNPLPYTEENVAAGQELFTIYCAVCHGDKGDGKGILAEREKILGIPAYNAPGRDITMGSTYYVMYYGLNTMGSYASQTTAKERWQIAHYVMDLKRALNGAPKREFVKVPKSAEKQNENLVPTVNTESIIVTETAPEKEEMSVETDSIK